MTRSSVLEQAKLLARRQDEDEQLVEQYASGEGSGRDIRPIREFVRHVRRDLGPRVIICKVEHGRPGSGQAVVAWYFFPEEGEAPASAAPSPVLRDLPTRVGDSDPRAP